MRFHKAVEVTEEQARAITGTPTPALSSVVVISQGEHYYDVRGMTQAEIQAFVDDLARIECAAVDAAAARPH
jgi:hypothetical protein